MFGPSILVSAKVKKALYKNNRYFFPVSEDDPSKWWSIDVYLPSSEFTPYDVCWYYYGNKQRGTTDIPKGGFLQDILLENNEYGVYVKGGTILPIKIHKYSQAILRTLLMPIRLDIYLDVDRVYAEGLLYLDDGESFRYQTHYEKSLLKYTYDSGLITCESQLAKEYVYPGAYSLKIVEVNIYGLDRSPSNILSATRKRHFSDFDYSKTR